MSEIRRKNNADQATEAESEVETEDQVVLLQVGKGTFSPPRK